VRALALDTSTWWGGAALVEGGPAGARTVVEIGVQVPDSHAVRLVSWVELLLAEAGWTRSDLDGYAASVGPGSFTGIRVGLGFLRGLAVATARPCAGVTTLEAIACAHGPAEHERVVLLDAGREQLFAARFDASGSPPAERVAPVLVLRDTAWSEGILAPPAVVVPGPGTVLDRSRAPRGVRIAGAPTSIAAAVGRVALDRPVSDGPGLAPLYVRPPDAILNRRSPKRGA
jgi:tRNA threonylcarbamoyladenosine biosynthesis protein TsaB